MPTEAGPDIAHQSVIENVSLTPDISTSGWQYQPNRRRPNGRVSFDLNNRALCCVSRWARRLIRS